MKELVLKFLMTHPDAKEPIYATDGAACFDVCAVGLPASGIRLLPQYAHTFQTGLKFEVPRGWVMKVYSRSGHGFKNEVRLANCVGIIDSDYRGELLARLHNSHHFDSLMISNGDRIAQCMLEPAPQVKLEQVTKLTATQRGENGLGSTGR